jgi:hypothetical protein
MAGVFQNIDLPSPQRPASVYPPPLVRVEDKLARGRGGWGVNILEDVRHSSVLYVCKYVVVRMQHTSVYLALRFPYLQLSTACTVCNHLTCSTFCKQSEVLLIHLVLKGNVKNSSNTFS